MAARATLNKLEPQIKSLSDTLQDVKWCVQEVVDDEGRLQDRVDFIEEEMKLLKEHLNTVIKEMNDIHRWVDNLVDKDNRDWRCYGEFGFADNK